MKRVFDDAVHGRADAEGTEMFFDATTDGWHCLLLGSLGLAVAFAFLGHKIDGNRGNTVGGAIGGFLASFCLGAELDALRRRNGAWRAARSRAGQDEATRADDAARIMRLVEAPGIGMLLGLACGILGVILWIFVL
jgi:hypothetical protein